MKNKIKILLIGILGALLAGCSKPSEINQVQTNTGATEISGDILTGELQTGTTLEETGILQTGFTTSPEINTGETGGTETGVITRPETSKSSGTWEKLLQKKGSKPSTSGIVQTGLITSLPENPSGSSDQVSEKDIEYLEKIIDSLVQKQ